MAEKDIQDLIEAIRLRTENFYNAHRLCCSEAIMVVLNQGFDGGLSNDTVVRMGSGFCGGMGGEEGTCGALTGAVATLGLLVGPGQKGGLSKSGTRSAAKRLHDQFQAEFGSTCCQELCEKFKHQRKARHCNCQKITGRGAAMAARIILELRPELAKTADSEFLNKSDSKLRALFQKIFNFQKAPSKGF